MRLLQLTLLFTLISFNSFQTSAESNKKYKASSLSNVSDTFITLKITIDSDGVATVSKTSKAAKRRHRHTISMIGFKPKFTKTKTSASIEMPEITEDRKLYVFDIDLLHPPRPLDNETRTGGWVYIYARSVKYLE